MTFKKALYILYVCIIAEVIIHVGFSLYMHTPLLHAQHIIYRYYPMIKEIKAKYAHADPKAYKVLILSSSTLHKDWGNFEACLLEKWRKEDTTAPAGKPSIAVYNAAGVGYSTLDNLNCYNFFADLKFDLVVDYIGINDARFNNCPPDVYQQNYGHIKWNNETNCILRHPEIDYLITPFLVDYTCQLLYEAFFKNRFIPSEYYSRPSWWEYGSDMKSLSAFSKNLEATSQLAASRHEQVLFVSYCYHIPIDYTLQKFKKRELDYAYSQHSREVEIWGRPDAVAAYLSASNDSTRLIAMRNHNAYADIRPSFRESKYYADVCHFSPLGLSVFSGLVADEIKRIKN